MTEINDKYKELIEDGDRAFELGNREEAASFYESAYEIKKSGSIAFKIFVWYISQSDYITALNWLLELRKFGEYPNDYYTYALLLNNFVVLPEEVQEEISSLDGSDLRLTYLDNRFDDRDLNNRIRYAIAKEQYNYAYNLVNKIVARGNSEPQEYVIYRLLKEKVVKEPKMIKKMIEEERYNDVFDYLNNKPNYQRSDEMAMQLLKDIYDLLDGIVIESTNKVSTKLFDAIYNGNYEKALELCNGDMVIETLLKKVIELNQINRINKFKGDLGYYFYETCEVVSDNLNNKDYDAARDKAKEYINVIGRLRYNNYLVGMINVMRYMPEYQGDILNILSDITYGYKGVDTDYLKKLFGISLNDHNYEAAAALIHVFKFMGKQEGLNVEYLEFVYNRYLYENEGVTYPTQEEDNNLIDRINELIREQSEDSQIKMIESCNQHEEFVIKYTLKNTSDSFYTVVPNSNPAVFYLKRNTYSDSYRRDVAITKINSCIKSNDYESALKNVKDSINNSKDFDYVLLSFAAYLYDLMGNVDRCEYIKGILLNVFGIDNYEDIINSDEVLVLDSSNNYVEFVKQLINKPIK